MGVSQGFGALKNLEFPTTLKSFPEVLGGSIVTFVDTKQVLFHPNPDPSFMSAKGAKFVNLPSPVGSICSRVGGAGSWDDCQGAWVHRCHGTDLGAQKVAFLVSGNGTPYLRAI